MAHKIIAVTKTRIFNILIILPAFISIYLFSFFHYCMADNFYTKDNLEINDVKQFIINPPVDIWTMDSQSLAQFCIDNAEIKQHDVAVAENEMEQLVRLLTKRLSEQEATELRHQQQIWFVEHKKRADNYFSAEENLSEQEQADTQATCYPYKSLNRILYNLITTNNRINELKETIRNYEIDKAKKPYILQSEESQFVGVYSKLWLPVGYSLLSISHNDNASEPYKPFKLVFLAESILPNDFESSCQMNLMGTSNNNNNNIEFTDQNNLDFLIQATWNNDGSIVTLHAVEFDNPSKEYDGDASLYYCGKGMSFEGSYYSMTLDN